MAKKIESLEVPMLKVTLGYGTEFILPWEQGIALMSMLRDAIPVKSKYENSGYVWSRKTDGEGVRMEAFAPEFVAQVLMGGV